jgi:hypothetical protein
MAWIAEQLFFDRSLRNDLVSLRALRTATAVLAVQTGSTKKAETSKSLADIDAAILETQKLIDGGSHHP